MLMKLKSQMKEGAVVPTTLVVEDKDQTRQTIEIQAPVRPIAASGGGMKY